MAEVKFCFDSNGINHPLNQYDANRHAEEVKQLWDDYNKRKNKIKVVGIDETLEKRSKNYIHYKSNWY